MDKLLCHKRARGVASLVMLVALWLTVLAAPLEASAANTALTGYPDSMASTGDSITRAFNTGTWAFTDAIANSWSTGTNSKVNSQYSRILARNSLISGKNYNHAVTGAQMADLAGQVSGVNSRGVKYVTILMGANDACTSSEATMTPVTTFTTQFETAMQSLSLGSPDARIFVSSIPNIYNLWNIYKGNSSARFIWSLYNICQSMLANPASTAQADVDRRARVLQRVKDFNTQLKTVCARYIHCRYDNDASFNTQFLTTDVSTRDYFHPSVAGQTKLANVSYAATFNFSDNIAPVTTASLASGTVSLTATDSAGVAGIEYKLDGAANWTRYSGPLPFAPGQTLTYRAVDKNGNVEAAKSL